tara:strand:- start:22 stop:630 length:609 start_codon:yes stop_codon:yes gene_type:complete
MSYKQPYKSPALKIDFFKKKSRSRKIAETKNKTFNTDKGSLTRDEMRKIANTGYGGSSESYQIEKTDNDIYDRVGYNKIGVEDSYAPKYSKELSRTSLTPKETKSYLKSQSKADDSKGSSGYGQMREEIKYARSFYKGKNASKKQKEQWSGIDGKKNSIKNKYGRGRFRIKGEEGKGLEKGIGASPKSGSNQSFCTATGNCT